MTAKVIIIGAPRSGTNMLRDLLVQAPGVATWPCDEINLVWRHGNRDHASDELNREHATPAVASYVQGRFERLAATSDASTVVEKTCANSLRVGFVDRCVPDAKFVLITRDGIDAAASAAERWNAPFDLRYTAAKARFAPPSDVPFYAGRFLRNRLAAKRGAADADSRMVSSWWGPRLHDMDDLMRAHTLDEICAIQWQRCVDASLDDLADIDAARVHRVVYEEFVSDPASHLKDILAFMEVDLLGSAPEVGAVSRGSVGKGRMTLGEARVSRLEELVGPTLARLGYA